MAKKGFQQRGTSATPKGGVQGTVAMSHNDCNSIWMGNWDQNEEGRTHELNSWMERTNHLVPFSSHLELNGNRFKYKYFANLPQDNSPKLCSVNDKRFIPVLKRPMTEKSNNLFWNKKRLPSKKKLQHFENTLVVLVIGQIRSLYPVKTFLTFWDWSS